MNTNEQIDSTIKEFNFVSDYIKLYPKRLLWISAIDALQAFPDFNSNIQKIRDKLNISPAQNIKALEDTTGFRNFRARHTALARGVTILDVENTSELHVLDYINTLISRFTSIDNELISLKVTFNKIPKS